MTTLSQEDFQVRVLLIQCCIGELTSKLLSKIKIGSQDVNCKLKELQVIQGMLKSLKCYEVLVDNITPEDNCLSEQDIQSMFDYMSSKCNICFQYPGFQYTDNDGSRQFDDSFSDSFH